MNSVFIRIDDRLIHGVVIQGWVKALHIGRIIVADDRVASDNMQRALLCMAVPSSLKISIFNIKESAERLTRGEFKNENVLVLVCTPTDALSLIENGLVCESINVGGLHFSPGKRQILKAISLGNKDIEALLEINKRGVKLEVRIIPTDASVDIMEYIKK